MSINNRSKYFRRILDTTVKMAGQDKVRIESVIKDRRYDLVLETLITFPGEIILEAYGELKEGTRTQQIAPFKEELSKLVGLKVGPGFIRQVKEIFQSIECQDIIVDALVETARCLMQLNDISGVSLPKDLDFSDAKAVRNFEVSIRPDFLNLCIPFQEGIEKTFASRNVMVTVRPDIYGPRPGQIYRFRRDKVLEANIYDSQIDISEYLIDDSHEINVEMLVDTKTNQILEADSQTYRLPYKNLCELPFVRVAELAGSFIDSEFRQKVFQSLGGSSGCAHLVDIIFDMTRYMEQNLI